MNSTASTRRNVEAVLAALKITGVVITREETDRVYGWDTDGNLLAHAILHAWIEDFPKIAQHHHGDSVVASYRERTSPSLQVCVHKIPPEEVGASGGMTYFVEIDIDFDAPDPLRPDRLLLHGVEVLTNQLTRRKTDPVEVARRLSESRDIRV